MQVTHPQTISRDNAYSFTFFTASSPGGIQFLIFKERAHALQVHELLEHCQCRIDFLPGLSPLCNADTSEHTT